MVPWMRQYECRSAVIIAADRLDGDCQRVLLMRQGDEADEGGGIRADLTLGEFPALQTGKIYRVTIQEVT